MLICLQLPRFLKNMLVHIQHFPPAVISLLASHPGIDLWNMPRCVSKVALHVYAIDRAPVKERRDYSTPCGFGNFWCLRFALNVWPNDAPQLWEFLFPLGLFHVGSVELSVISPLFLPASAVVLLDTAITSFCSLWMVFSLAECVQIQTLLFLCLLPLSPRRPSATEIRGKTPLQT